MFVRGGDVKETMGIGTFAPMVKDLKVLLEEEFIERKNVWTYYSRNSDSYSDPKSEIVEWKSFPGGSNNICKLVALVRSTDPHGMKEFMKADIENIKGIFKGRDCKMSSLNFFSSESQYRKYGFASEGKSTIIIEFVYSKNKLAKN
jgi:hypothetical protein